LGASDQGHTGPERRKQQRRSGADRRVGERRRGFDRRGESEWEPVRLDDEISSSANEETGLIAAAIDARTHARARFSRFQVGAALETGTGHVISGCNIENATYGLTICAERVALFKALSEGHDLFTRVVVVAETDDPTPPCGACRQLLWEYCGDIEVVLANLAEVKKRLRLSELLPYPFDARFL